MKLSEQAKKDLKNELVECLCSEKEISKIVVFGSFITSANPHDMDVAVFQDGTEGYLPLALKYRKKTRSVARKIPLDIFPLKTGGESSPFLAEISSGAIIYEK